MIVLKIILGLIVMREEKRGQAPQKELAEAALVSPLLCHFREPSTQFSASSVHFRYQRNYRSYVD